MKTNTLFFLLALTFSLNAHSQITKGNWMMGGNASFSNKETFQNEFPSISKIKFTEFDINVNLGYFFIDNLQAGVRLGYTDYNVSTFEGFDRFSQKYGAYSRYYFLKPEKLVNVYIDGNYFFGKRSISSGEMQGNLNGYAIGVGPTIFLNSSVAMELGINYSSTKFKSANNFTDITENNLQFSFGLQIFLEKQ